MYGIIDFEFTIRNMGSARLDFIDMCSMYSSVSTYMDKYRHIRKDCDRNLRQIDSAENGSEICYRLTILIDFQLNQAQV